MKSHPIFETDLTTRDLREVCAAIEKMDVTAISNPVPKALREPSLRRVRRHTCLRVCLLLPGSVA